ncbi:MAG TPA: alcohol dehydrogenase catalytic domain-containing protein [Candidatus Saccharimonadales bacterium]|nr:alcohol dehydrogenase catalytic domain-containing protein [Candidatus Saccharimonadales bacterium]
MLAVVKKRPAPGVAVEDIPKPVARTGEVLVRVRAASICGTDVSIYDWTPWAAGHIKPPMTLGHELVGEVLEVNDVRDVALSPGDLVSSETHIFCGRCYQCRIGNRHICENMELFGIGRDGGFAEYATIPVRTTWKNDPSLDPEVMSAQEPLGNAVHVVTKADVPGKTVLILGLGPVGLSAIAVANAYGAKRVIGVNRGAYRRKLGLAMGADEVHDAVPRDLTDACDVVLEMSGSTEAVEDALRAARIGGRIVLFGIPKEPAHIDIGRYVINKELSLESVFGRRIWSTWYQVSDLLLARKVDLAALVTHRFKLGEFEKAMAVMKSGECGKIVLLP